MNVHRQPAARSSRQGGLARQRSFRLLWAGQATSDLGDSMAELAVPLAAVAMLHAGPFAVSVLYAAQWLPWLVLGLPAGAWADRWPPRRVMLACDAICLLLFASVPAAAAAGALTLGQLAAVAVLAGTAAMFFTISYAILLPSLVPAPDLVEGNALLAASQNAAQVAGPGAAGYLAGTLGAVTGVLADAVTFAVSGLCLLAIREPPAARPARPPGRPPLAAQIKAGLAVLLADPYLRTLTAAGAAANLALVGYQSIEVVFLTRDAGATPAVIGGLLAVIAAGGIAGAAVARPLARRLGTARGFLICELGTAPFGLLLPLAGPGVRIVWFAAGGSVLVAGIVAGNILSGSFFQAYCPPGLLGRISSARAAIGYGAIPAGALTAGTLGTLIGTRATLLIMTVAVAAASLLLLTGPLRTRRDFPARPVSDTGG